MAPRLSILVCCLAFLLPAQSPLRRTEPVYPELAKAMRIQGRVEITVAIDTDGTVLALKLISGHPLLVDAAMDAVKHWTYPPAARRRVETVQIPFTISHGAAEKPARI
jgi:TonB family protein